MALPNFSMRQLLEAGVHFGHSTRRWNPKMSQYIFGARNNVHIIDLQQTVPLLDQALQAIRDISAGGGRILFVGTKRQASERVADYAKRCGQYFVNHRWLGGMLTNWQTISNSIKRLRELDAQLESNESLGMTKRELLFLTRERDKLERALGGIKDMGALPDMLFVLDVNKDMIAVQEANKLRIPVVAVIDSNSDPDGVSYPIPGNDDALRAINLYLQLASDAVLDGLQSMMVAQGVDVGESAEPEAEGALSDAEIEATAEAEHVDEAPAEAAAEAAPEATPEAAPEAATEEQAAAPTSDATMAEKIGDPETVAALEEKAEANAAADDAATPDAGATEEKSAEA